MINSLLYVATATALINVVMFDENFAANLSRGLGEEAAIMLDPWVAGMAASSWVCSPPPFTGSAADEDLAHLCIPDRDPIALR
jgi:hypothetical protein